MKSTLQLGDAAQADADKSDVSPRHNGFAAGGINWDETLLELVITATAEG